MTWRNVVAVPLLIAWHMEAKLFGRHPARMLDGISRRVLGVK